jgi:hypothetical protein
MTPEQIATVKDFAATAEQISMHGLGFLQIKLPGNQRLHVWHPDLPRRSCYEHSQIHNHRFAFRSTIMVGQQVNQRVMVRSNPLGGHDRISHDGPRSPLGGRLSYVAERVEVMPLVPLTLLPGQSYEMREGEYHCTPNSGIVVTLMLKLREGTEHASSIITHGHEFDQSFDRFQLSEDQLWAIALDALRGAA